MAVVYRDHFRPRSEYVELFRTIPSHRVAVHVRRGDHPTYYVESRQSVEELGTWIQSVASTTQKNIVRAEEEETNAAAAAVVVVSDDLGLCRSFNEMVDNESAVARAEERMRDDDASAMLNLLFDFFVLSKALVVFGTPRSSFSEEAVCFGGVSGVVRPTLSDPDAAPRARQ